ncbi:MAG: hypothetical protein IT406_01475 [Candidatus Yanofskybacteria bacterium]|nr:hypothetical protein [Candidatus Yanofskybacteria bacterium]
MAKAETSHRNGSAAKDVWRIQGLESRCRELIQSGALLRKGGLESILQTLRTEFVEKLTGGLRLSKQGLIGRLPKLIWTTQALDALKRAIRTNIPLDEFRKKYYPYIPEDLFAKKAKFLTGVTNAHASAKFIAGMGRLSTEELSADAELFEFPESSFANPFVVPAGADWTVAFVNGGLIGIKHNRLIKDNPVRRALSDAEKRGDACVVITNGLSMDLKKAAGPIKTYRAQVSGLHVKIEHLPASYQAKARRILASKALDEVIFMPLEAKFLGFLDAWHKITHRPDGSPEFGGPVLYPLGHVEEELINTAAYYEVRYITLLEQKQLEAHISFTKRELARAYSALNSRSAADRRQAAIDIAKYEQDLRELTEERAMTIITNVSDQDLERRRRRLRALLAKKLEEVIPNCRVIGQGTSHIKVGDYDPIEIYIPGHVEVTDGLLSSFVDEFGAKAYRGAVPHTAVICHPYALNHRMVGRDHYKNGQRDSSEVHVAPICIDESFLRAELRGSTKAVHPVSKVLKSEQFRPGVLVLQRVNGIVTGDSFPIAKLDNSLHLKRLPKAQRPKAGIPGYYPYPETRYIWTVEMTDIHMGSRSREHIFDTATRRNLGVSEAVAMMMRRDGILDSSDFPIHLLTINDDPTQGNHYDTHKQPDPSEMSYDRIEKWWRTRHDEIAQAAKKGDSAAVMQLTLDAARFDLGQFLARGLDWVQPQMLEVFTRLIDPNLDFFDSVLRRSQRSKLVIRGLSEIRGIPYDGRDVGILNIGSGNHLAASVQDTLTEGVFYAQYLRARLAGLSHWKDQQAFLDRYVLAPLYSNEYFALGTICAPGGYEWGLTFLASPARLSSWSDPLSAVVNNDRARGDSFGHATGRVTLKTYGDKHFKNKVITPYAIYVMGPANTHTDLYGERGFPPNNTGVLFIGLPVGGPEDGPVLVRSLMYDQIRDWFANPRSFDWRKFLPKPV